MAQMEMLCFNLPLLTCTHLPYYLSYSLSLTTLMFP